MHFWRVIAVHGIDPYTWLRDLKTQLQWINRLGYVNERLWLDTETPNYLTKQISKILFIQNWINVSNSWNKPTSPVAHAIVSGTLQYYSEPIMKNS